MSEPLHVTTLMRREAADWFARLNNEAAAEADWLTFTAWLEAEPAHRLAYDEVEAAWVALDDVSPPAIAGVVAFKPRARRAGWFWGVGAAAAAAIAAFVAPGLLGPSPQVFESAAGQSRTIRLSDGSSIALSSGSKVEVRFRGRHRDASLDRGEADFDIVHDPSRPFTVAVGKDTIRVLGTQFDVQRRLTGLTVSVERGLVSVSAADGAAVEVPAGRQLRRMDGANHIRPLIGTEASAWRAGRLIYRDAPLAEVAEDLSRYGSVPISVEPGVADLKVTAVLKLDAEEAMVDRLQSFLPIQAETTATHITLRGAGG
jgi:transmembrane sensor